MNHRRATAATSSPTLVHGDTGLLQCSRLLPGYTCMFPLLECQSIFFTSSRCIGNARIDFSEQSLPQPSSRSGDKSKSCHLARSGNKKTNRTKRLGQERATCRHERNKLWHHWRVCGVIARLVHGVDQLAGLDYAPHFCCSCHTSVGSQVWFGPTGQEQTNQYAVLLSSCTGWCDRYQAAGRLWPCCRRFA